MGGYYTNTTTTINLWNSIRLRTIRIFILVLVPTTTCTSAAPTKKSIFCIGFPLSGGLIYERCETSYVCGLRNSKIPH